MWWQQERWIHKSGYSTRIIICYYGNGLLYEDNDKGTYYHHYNNIGSTILLTNSSGKIVEEYTYGTYGELLSGDTSKTKYLYNGQYGIQTEINGLLYMRTRYYNPEVKRFINQDTVLGSIINSQSLNRYAYVQGNPISLIDPFGMSPENGKNALGHAILDVMGLIPVAGAICDAANCVWYILDDNYAMAAISAFAAIPGLGDLASAGKLATKGAKVAELCNIIKKLGYAAKVAENAGEIAINATNMYVDYAIKEKEFGIDTVASLLALGLNGFGIYASIKRYYSISLDLPSVNTGKVTEGVEGENKVAEKYHIGLGNDLDNYDYYKANKEYDRIMSGSDTVELTKNNIQHIKKHTFEGMLEQSKYLSDKQLESILEKRTFFNRNWSNEQINRYTEEAYNILHSQGKTGLQSIEIHGEIINVFIKEDGTFDTAYGIYKYTVENFR